MSYIGHRFRPSVGVSDRSCFAALCFIICFRGVLVLSRINTSVMSLRAVIALQDTRTVGLVALVDQEAGVRGYVATRNPLFLDVYRRGLSRYVLSTKRFDNSPSVDPSSLSAYSDVLNKSSLILHFLRNEIALTQ